MKTFKEKQHSVDLSEFCDAQDIIDSKLPSSYRLLQYLICALTIVGICWLCLTSTDVVSTASGRIVPFGQTKVLQAPEQGLVRTIYVKDGDIVKKGDLLITFDPTISTVDVGALKTRHLSLQYELARLQAESRNAEPAYPHTETDQSQILVQESLRQARKATLLNRIHQVDAELENSRSNQIASQQSIRLLEESRQASIDHEARIRPYIGQAIPMTTYLTVKETLISKERELVTNKEKLKASINEIKSIEEKRNLILEENRAQILAELYAKRAEANAISAELEKSIRGLGIKELRAPLDGMIQHIALSTQGAVVTPAQNLITIVPLGAPVIIEGFLANSDIGFAKEGQQVSIKFDAYPFMQYGKVTGVLDWISPDAEVGIDKTQPQASVYRIRVKLDNLSKSQNAIKVRSGMTVAVDIRTDRRKLLTLLFQPIFRYIKDATQQR